MGAMRQNNSRRWLLRDLPRAGVLLTWIAFALSVMAWVVDWNPLHREAAIVPPPSAAARAEAAAQAAAAAKAEGDVLYTGSIITVPSQGEDCWQRRIDNRNGKMWDVGVVNCYTAVAPTAYDGRTTTSAARMNSISKAFRHGD